ncbi:MAG TPA: 50S ribosomal protein L25 [Patescibacteria group bacterium]|nr:50S ribosomal protein L25 [Patescibacteria group bacterium]
MAKKEEIKLSAEKRKVVGRKVKSLRKGDLLPANIYGKKVKSLAVQLNLKLFLDTYRETGETGIVKLKIKDEKTFRPILIHNVQLDPVTDRPLHVDFYQVDLKEKVTIEVPIELVGEAPAVKGKIGILIQPLTEVEVEALPAELPDKLELDVSSLEKVDDVVSVADLKVPKGIKILVLEKEVLAKIEPLAEEEEIAPPPEEEVSVGVEVEEKPSEEETKQPVGEEKEKQPSKEPETSAKKEKSQESDNK